MQSPMDVTLHWLIGFVPTLSTRPWASLILGDPRTSLDGIAVGLPSESPFSPWIPSATQRSVVVPSVTVLFRSSPEQIVSTAMPLIGGGNSAGNSVPAQQDKSGARRPMRVLQADYRRSRFTTIALRGAGDHSLPPTSSGSVRGAAGTAARICSRSVASRTSRLAVVVTNSATFAG